MGTRRAESSYLLAQTHPVPCHGSSGPLNAMFSHLGSSGREPALRVAMFSPVSRPNMFEALCSWAWIPAGSKLMTESSTHSKQALVCTGLSHLFCLNPTWYMTSSLFTARGSEAAMVNWFPEVYPFCQQGDSTLIVSSALSAPCCLLPPHST